VGCLPSLPSTSFGERRREREKGGRGVTGERGGLRQFR